MRLAVVYNILFRGKFYADQMLTWSCCIEDTASLFPTNTHLKHLASYQAWLTRQLVLAGIILSHYHHLCYT